MAYISKSDQVRSNRPKKYKNAKKKPKPRVKTPRPEGEYKCAGCGKTKYLQIHHVYFNRGNRDLSSMHKCVEWICYT